MVGLLLACASALTFVSGAAASNAVPNSTGPYVASASCGHFTVFAVIEGITSVHITSVPAGTTVDASDLVLGDNGPYAIAAGNWHYVFNDDTFSGDFSVAQCKVPDPTTCATAPNAIQAVPAVSPTACIPTCVVLDAVVTPAPTPCSTPFESFEGQTLTPPPTGTVPAPSGGGDSVPLPALLLSFAFGALGLVAVMQQRRSLRRL